MVKSNNPELTFPLRAAAFRIAAEASEVTTINELLYTTPLFFEDVAQPTWSGALVGAAVLASGGLIAWIIVRVDLCRDPAMVSAAVCRSSR